MSAGAHDNSADQGSAAWFAARAGKCTASRVGDATAKLKSGKWAATREAYAIELICERLTKSAADHYTSPAMAWGTENEPAARAAYEFIAEVTVTAAGFVQHPRLTMSGASPDGYVGDQGLLEIKCPTTATHIKTLLSGEVPEDHLPQILWQQACCSSRAWTDFVSFDPRLPPEMATFIRRVPRDNAAILVLEIEVANFLAEVDAKIAELHQAVSPHRQAA